MHLLYRDLLKTNRKQLDLAAFKTRRLSLAPLDTNSSREKLDTPPLPSDPVSLGDRLTPGTPLTLGTWLALGTPRLVALFLLLAQYRLARAE